MTNTTQAQAVNLNEILDRYRGGSRESLIPLLQDVQEVYGYLPKSAVTRVAELLKLPTSKVYGVATFYNQFRFDPIGRFHVQVCRGTACHVKGSAKVLGAVERELGVKAGQPPGTDSSAWKWWRVSERADWPRRSAFPERSTPGSTPMKSNRYSRNTARKSL